MLSLSGMSYIRLSDRNIVTDKTDIYVRPVEVEDEYIDTSFDFIFKNRNCQARLVTQILS